VSCATYMAFLFHLLEGADVRVGYGASVQLT
jgi:hypothetical protein